MRRLLIALAFLLLTGCAWDQQVEPDPWLFYDMQRVLDETGRR